MTTQRPDVADPPIDTRPLVDPVDRARLRVFRATLPASVRPGVVQVLWQSVALFVAPLLFLVLWATLLGDRLFSADAWRVDWSLFLLLVPYVLLAVVMVLLGVRVIRRRSGVRQYRLDGFARANGLEYRPEAPSPVLPGMIFNRPGETTSRATDVLVRRTAPRLTIGNHTATIGSGRQAKVHTWGYVDIRLDAVLPHLVLDARANNSIRRPRLPVAFARSQRLSLEGDFDRHFALYCPDGYEADALYLFTPDIMARFIDTAALFDVEIVEDHLFLYAPGQMSTLDPEHWTRLLDAVDVVTRRVTQWERWRDERLRSDGATVLGGRGAPSLTSVPRGVASGGRRLRFRADWWWLLMLPVLGYGLFLSIRDAIMGTG